MKQTTGKPDEQLGYLLAQVSFLKQRIVNAALKELDITYIQFIILAGTLELNDGNTIVTQQLISDERRLDKAMVSNVVKTLIEKGLITRNVHPEDKRAYTLSLTDMGAQKAIHGKKIALNIDEFFFKEIDKKKLYEFLRILLNNENKLNEYK